MDKSVQQHHSLVEFLSEFARYLIASGITFPQFEDAAQLGFVRAASESARMRNERVNQSAVAAMTGLSRTQVRSQLARPKKVAKARSTRLDQLIWGWTTDPRFITARRTPRALDLRRCKNSFADLVKLYGSDIPPKALLSDLQRRQLVVVDDHFVKLEGEKVENRAARELRQFSHHLSSALKRQPNESTHASLKSISIQLSYPALASIGQVLLRRRVKQGLEALLADIENAAKATTQSEGVRKTRKGRMSKLSVIVLTQD